MSSRSAAKENGTRSSRAYRKGSGKAPVDCERSTTPDSAELRGSPVAAQRSPLGTSPLNAGTGPSFEVCI